MSLRPDVCRLLTDNCEATPDQGKPSLFEQEANGHHNGYNTFGYPSEINSECSTSTCRDVHNESAPLLASSPSVDHWLATNQRKATVFDLLRAPRLPLALASTVVMAVTFAALETVRSSDPLNSPLTHTNLKPTDPSIIRHGNIQLVLRWCRPHLRRLLCTQLRRHLHRQSYPAPRDPPTRHSGLFTSIGLLGPNASCRRLHNRPHNSAHQSSPSPWTSNRDYRGRIHD